MSEQKKKINFKYNFALYWSLLKRYWMIFFGILLISLGVEISLGVGKYLFKMIIDRGNEFGTGDLKRIDFINQLKVIALVYLGLISFRAVSKWIYIHFLIKLDSSLIYDLKEKFFSHLVFLDHDFHTTHKSGSLISRLTRGGRSVEMMSDIIVFHFSPLVFQLIVVGTSLFYFNIGSAISIIVTVLVFIGYSYYIQNIQQSYNLKVNKSDDTEKGFISDVFTNIDSIKYFGKEKDIKEKYAQYSFKTKLAQRKHWNFFRWWDLGHTFILGVGTFFVVYFPIAGFINKQITIGTVVFTFTLFTNLLSPLFMFVFGMRNFYHCMADFESLFQYNRIENKIKDDKDAQELNINHGTIDFKDISFKYHKQKLFKKLNLSIKKNEKVALVGHSGCGKTTLVKLLYRLYDLDKGAISIDNTDITTVKQETLRREMSIVPQECILFDDTIYNNILFSKPTAKRREVLRAMRFAQLDKIVKNFPQKDQTIVGERGVKLSGGEKQRISIARAILADKKIVVLDEATSALDSKTEYEIQKDLQKLLQGRTSIIIAHRLSTIMKADRVIVMENGNIVQMGKHNDLVEEPGVYKELWNLQKNGYIE